MKQVKFVLPCVYICFCVAPLHTCEMQKEAQMQAQENDFFFHLLRRPLHLRLHWRWVGYSSHVWNAKGSANASARKWFFFPFLASALALAFAFSFAFAFVSLVWTRLKTFMNFFCLNRKILQTEAMKRFQVENILSKIYVFRCHDYMQLIALSHVLPDFLAKHSKVR